MLSKSTIAAAYAVVLAVVASCATDALNPHLVSPESYINACPDPVPSSIIKPPSSGSADPELSNTNLSSTNKLLVFNVVVVPLIVKSPVTTKLVPTLTVPENVLLPDIVSVSYTHLTLPTTPYV